MVKFAPSGEVGEPSLKGIESINVMDSTQPLGKAWSP